jgi:hypothetical protein
MRIFYTGSDMEDLAASGVKQLEVGPGVTLTDAARERAEELGIALVVPGKAAAPAKPAPAAQSAGASSGTLPARPRGCQHGPLSGTAGGAPSATVEQLVDAVSALKKKGA